MINSGLFTSNDDTWTTPRNFFDKYDAVYNFGLDAAALKTSALCTKYFGPDHENPEYRDALTADWVKASEGLPVWLNPPYGRSIKGFVAKADLESKRGGVTVVCLVPARTDTAWFQDYCLPHDVTFIRGRLKFGDAKNSAPFPSAVVVMGGR